MIKDILTKNETKTPDSKALSVLKEHFPGCFEKDGSFDMERFKELLSDKVEVRDEGYELRFLGKNYARLLASLDTTTVVVPNEEHNGKPENKDSENIYITGDNLDGLKHLLKSYAGKIKCIYIDPPYNTGSDDFVYKDSFSFTAENLSEKLSISEEKALRILDLTKRGSASHSAWLMFMYPRLLLARDLLTEDGVIFISIDDNECHNLKLICDDAFGEENFITSFIWERKNKPSFLNTNLGTKTEYILSYGKNRLLTGALSVDTTEVGKKYPFNNAGNRVKELIFPPKSVRFLNISNETIKPQNMSEGNIVTELLTELVIENGYNLNEFTLKGEWRYSQETLDELVANEEEITISKIPFRPNHVKKGGETKKIHNLLTKSHYNIPTNENATSEQIELMGAEYFDYIKPSGLIEFLIKASTYSEESCYVLDFFSGSGTTAHSTIKLNAEDSVKRKFIMVQLPESIEEGKAAFKAGYKTIDEIGIDRIKKVAAKIKVENPETELDLGFKHYSLQEPSQNTLDKILEFDPTDKALFGDRALLDEFGETTILRTWLASDGYGLTEEAQEVDLDGYKAYLMKNHLYLIDAGIEDESIEDLVVRYETDPAFNPENLIVFGYSFTWRQMEQLQINLKRLKGTEKNLSINIDVRY